MCLVMLGSGSALGADHYVDNSVSAECRDIPTFGSEARPWCTIGYGLSGISGGDTLYVSRGTYDETVYIDGPAGSPDRPTTIRTHPGHRVTIRGRGNTGRVKITSTSHVTFGGFTVTNSNQGIFVDGGSHHIVIESCIVHDVGQEGIHIRENSHHVTIQECEIFNTQRLGGEGERNLVGN